MPYPLLKLPYGLQQRLRSLATPKEAYCLQVAIGFEQNYLTPIQICTTKYSDELFLCRKAEQVLLTRKHPWWNPGDEDVLHCEKGILYLVTFDLQLHYFQSSDYNTPVFNHLLIKSTKIALFKSVLNPEIFCQLTKQCNSDQVLQFTAIYYISPDLTVPMICDKFKNLLKLYLMSSDYAYRNWIKDLLNFRKLNLHSLAIGGEFERLFSFSPRELRRLFERENKYFSLTLVCWEAPINAVQLIRKKLRAHFKEFRSVGYGHFKEGFLNIKLGNGFAGEAHFALPTPEKVVDLWFQVAPLTYRMKQCENFAMPETKIRKLIRRIFTRL